MQLEERIHFLRKIDLFSSFGTEELQAFADKVTDVRLAVGELLFEEGDPGRDMFILLQGLLKVYRESRTITLIQPMDYVGEMAIIEEKPRSASVQAVKPSLLIKITSELFQEFFARQPQSLVAMMTTLSRRIRRDTEDIAAECEKANMMIHDMKNLVSPFYLIEVLEKKVPAVAGHRYVEYMRHARENLLMMMEEALANAKRRQWSSRAEANSLPELVREVVDSEFAVHPDLGGKELQVAVEGELPDFCFSSLDIRRVLSNLILNAAQASGKGSVIEIALNRRDGYAEVQVKDRGAGIPEGLQEKIFQSHFTTKSSGSGLGLASCKYIIEKRHGGVLTFQSEPGRGSVFAFSLPLS